MQQKNSFVSILEQIALLHKNSIELISKLGDVVSTNADNINVNFLNEDNTTTNYQLPSVGYLKSQIDQVLNNTKRLAGLDGSSYIFDGKSNKKVYSVDLNREPSPINNLDNVTQFTTDYNWFFENLMNPLLSVKIDLSGKIESQVNKVLSRRYIVKFKRDNNGNLTTDGNNSLTQFTNQFLNRTDINITDFLNWYTNANNTGVINNLTPDKSLDEQINSLDYKILNNKGLFSVLQIETDSLNRKIWYHLNTLNYETVDGNIKSLAVGDQIIINKKESNSRYEIKEISTSNSKLRISVERIEGYDPIFVGENVLELYSDVSQNQSVKISIGYNEYNVVFLKPINGDSNVLSSVWSLGTAFYTNDLVLESNNTITLIREYQEQVKDYGTLIKDLVSRMKPTYFGKTPNTVTLNNNNFKVVQINKYLTDSEDFKKLRELNSTKENLKSKLEQINNSISELNKQLNTKQFKSIAEKNKVQNQLNTLIANESATSKRLSSVVSQITSSNVDTSILPTYSLRGFFQIPNPIDNQEVIQFRIQYRKSAKNGGQNNATEGYNLDGKTAYFSNWKEYRTDIRKRSYDKSTETWTWIDENVESGESPNINQVDIPIQAGERIEVKIKSISEVGYPEAIIESDWSNILTFDFPDELTNLTNEIEIILNQADKDEAKIEINQELEAKGVLQHVQNSFSINDNYIAHLDSVIGTSFKDAQGNTILLSSYLSQLTKDITSLQEQVSRAKGELLVKVVNNTEEITVTNGSETTLVVECEDYGNMVDGLYRVYYNEVISIDDIFVRLENVASSSQLGLLSDRLYNVSGSTNTFFKDLVDSNIPLFVDENDKFYTQNNNQFIWSSNNHNGEYIVSDSNIGNFSSISVPNILNSDNKNLGLENLSTDILNNDITTLNAWTYTPSPSNANQFLATVHPYVAKMEYLVDESPSGIKTIDGGESFIIGLKIYFKFQGGDDAQFDINNANKYNIHQLTKRVKFFLETETGTRPFEFTVKMILKQHKTATYSSKRTIVNPIVNNSCFIQGTSIDLWQGSKEIESVKINDIVKSYDFELKENAPGKVIDILINDIEGYYSINNGFWGVSAVHRYWVKRNNIWNWLEAMNLQKGDELFVDNDSTIVVENKEFINKRVKVYNLTIEKYKNYYANGVLVHNKKILPRTL